MIMTDCSKNKDLKGAREWESEDKFGGLIPDDD